MNASIQLFLILKKNPREKASDGVGKFHSITFNMIVFENFPENDFEVFDDIFIILPMLHYILQDCQKLNALFFIFIVVDAISKLL